ncbi:outer membrane beta-barrel protein [Acetobacter sp.]|uniref:outer membrane beta-barrel protein n=1 Tax=Acetobacter sp. TaxID=440 RepID=UPI0039E9C130
MLRPKFNLFYGLTLCAAFVPRAASAQVVTEYLPALGSGAGELIEEPAQVRASKSYQPLGYRDGPLTVNLDGTESFGYSSNVDRLQHGRQSAAIMTAGHISAVRMLDRQDQVHAEVSVTDTRYPSRSLQNRTTWNGTIGATKHFGHDELGAAFTHMSLVQMPTESGALIITGPVPYNVDDGRVSYLFALPSRLSFRPEISVQHYYFGKPEVAGSSPFQDQSYRDRVIVNESVTARYQMLQNSHLLFLAQGTQIKYTGNTQAFSMTDDITAPRRNSTGFSVLGGYSWNEAGPFQFRALVGYQRRVFSSSLYGTISSPIAQASFRWLPTKLTTVSANITHGIEDAAFESIVGYTDTSAELRVTHAYSRNIVFEVHGNLHKAHYPASSPELLATPIGVASNNQNSYGGGVDLHVYLNRHISLDFSYEYMSQSAYLGPMFPVHVAMAGVHFAL